MRIVALLFVVLAVAGCSKEDLAYEYSVNGCSTGRQEFDSKEAMCAGLQSDSRNKGCALSERQDKFKQDGCSGSFTRGN